MKELLDKVRNTTLEVAVYLACYLALRREEVIGLKWENVDLENRIIYIVEVRTSAGKKVKASLGLSRFLFKLILSNPPEGDLVILA